jgi:hypothetical protein
MNGPDNIVPFRRPGFDGCDPGRFDALHHGDADVNRLAYDLGSPDEWLASAIEHLKTASSRATTSHVRVSSAALHLVLGHVERLEARLGMIPPVGGAA